MDIWVFHFLATGSNAAMKICGQVSVWTSFCVCVFCLFLSFFGSIPRSRIARSCSNFIFDILRNCQTVYKVVAQCYVHIYMTYVFRLFHILINTSFYLSFYYSHSRRCEVLSHCGFDYVKHLFMCLIYILWIIPNSDPLLIFKLVCLFYY
uniref:Uncharacterized protein n=1 Tax=Myotis myotis TaxID=51298 RepID=A0A7J7Y043_MYOMY|nr:hypothetical protein mMyoMyo1_011375 [Myotis myotis]